MTLPNEVVAFFRSEGALPGPRVDYAWHLENVVARLVDYIRDRDEELGAEVQFETLPNLRGPFLVTRTRQLDHLARLWILSGRVREAREAPELSGIVEEARGLAREVCRLQVRKEARLAEATAELGEGD